MNTPQQSITRAVTGASRRAREAAQAGTTITLSPEDARLLSECADRLGEVMRYARQLRTTSQHHIAVCVAEIILTRDEA